MASAASCTANVQRSLGEPSPQPELPQSRTGNQSEPPSEDEDLTRWMVRRGAPLSRDSRRTARRCRHVIPRHLPVERWRSTSQRASPTNVCRRSRLLQLARRVRRGVAHADLVRPARWSDLPTGRHTGPAPGSHQGRGRCHAGAGRRPTGPAYHGPACSEIRREPRADDMRAGRWLTSSVTGMTQLA